MSLSLRYLKSLRRLVIKIQSLPILLIQKLPNGLGEHQWMIVLTWQLYLIQSLIFDCSTDDLKSKVPEKKPRPNVTIPIEAAARVESHESTGSNDGSPLSPTAVVSAVKPEVNPKPKERPQPAKSEHSSIPIESFNY